MESSQKKRGLWGSFSLFSRKEAPSEPELNADLHRALEPGNPPPVPRVGFNASEPESPAKRASETQLSNRKILGRPKGPSSKLAQTLHATDFTQISATPSKPNPLSTFTPRERSASPKLGSLFSSASKASERRMPGDVPGKAYDRRMPGDMPGGTHERTVISPDNAAHKVSTRVPGDIPYKASSQSTFSAFPPRTNFSGAATTPRNMFRESAMKRPSAYAFSPKVPVNTMKQSFPVNTPGRAPRGATAEVNGRSLNHTESADLFPMKIPMPPEDLTGEAMAKEIPEDKNRVGSIYADQYLAHYCPDDFDDLQRRQFFCILDLRRLKYAADEIFAKKDWKINIMNFAKEYEKSRSLIMLRYGLYEFKTIRPSETVKKEWKQKHGIVDSDEESSALAPYKPSSAGSKRKAEEDLQSKDTALTTSSTNLNKRARAVTSTQTTAGTSSKNKRKASVDEGDENQPSKMQKSDAPAIAPKAPQSDTRSIFEKIANSPQTGSSQNSTAKPSPKKSGTSSAASKLSNGTPARSVFETDSQSANSHNIFSKLADKSKEVETADVEDETDSEDSAAEDEPQDGSEVRQPSQSDEPSVAPSGGVSTPQFGAWGHTNGMSSASSETGDSVKSRSLFDRVTLGTDGQPLRMPQPEATKPAPAILEDTRPASPAKDSAATPGNKTWNPDTPIKFAAPPTTSAPPPLLGGSLFAPAPSVPAEKSVSPAPISFGGALPKKSDEATPVQEAPKQAPSQGTPSLFNVSGTKPDSASSIFSSVGKPAVSTSTQFSSSTSAFGAPKPTESGNEKAAAAPPAPVAPSFGAASSGADTSKPSSIFQSSTLFGNANKNETSKLPAPNPLFAAAAEKASQTGAPASSIFVNDTNKRAAESDAPTPPPSNPLFGTPAKPSDASASASSIFASNTPKPAEASTSTSSIFANSTPKPASNLFGASTPGTKRDSSEPEGRPIKRAVGPSGKSSAFGASSTPAATPVAKSLFGAPSLSQQQNDTVMGSPEANKTGALAAGNTGLAPNFSFGGSAGAAPAFGAGLSQQPTSSIFGQAPKPATALFGGGSQQSGTSLFGGQPAKEQPAAASFGTTISKEPTTQPASQSFTTPASSFTFNAGGTAVKNPFSTGGDASATPSFNFGGNSTSAPSSFTFGGNTNAGNSVPSFNFGSTQSNTDGGDGGSFVFKSGASATDSGGMFSLSGVTPQTNGAPTIFGQHLAPAGGTSTGTNSPFTFGGASSLATTPATGTPEPGNEREDAQAKKPADGDEEPQAQISLTEGGPGEEDESVVHEVRTKALKLVTKSDSDEDENDSGKKDGKKSPWKVQGVGPLRVLKHKTTGAVRLLLRAEPRGSIALNKSLLPNFTYKPEAAGGKYVKITTSNDDGTGLETWMLQVKTPALAQALADSLEASKGS